MDSGTHLVMGLGLAGLATVDPVVTADPTVYSAILIGTIVGSQAPDLDTLLRLKGNAIYIRNHRGASHSIPAIAIWTLLISFLLQLAYGFTLPWLHLIGWILLAVVIHVFTDLFNTYGTQAYRPFSKKWVSWNIIHIFDPVIFTAHVIAITCWALRLADPAYLFPGLYAVLIVYYLWRVTARYSLHKRLPSLDDHYEDQDSYLLIPTISLYDWNVVKQRADGSYVIGDLKHGSKLRWVDSARCSDHPAVEQSMNDRSIQSFLSFTSFACAEVKEHSWGYEVRWSDVRYRHRKQYPFVGVLLMDSEYKTLGSYVGDRKSVV